MRVIISGGGTGGHIYPAIAIAKRIKKAIPDCDILYVGSHYGLEETIVKREGIAFHGIDVMPFDRKRLWRRIKALFILIKAFFQSFKTIRKYQPDLVIGTGGYVSGPVLLTAALLRKDTMIHEQNVVPGMTTRFLSKYVNKVLISFKESIPYFKEHNELYYTGVPVREEFTTVSRQRARQELYIDNETLLIVSLGGSNGAIAINQLSYQLINVFATRQNVHYTHITGKRFYDDYVSRIAERQLPDRINIIDYTDDMALLLAAADLVISRGGALSLAEFETLRLPSIIIPSPNVADDHQLHNAKVYAKRGVAVVVEEDHLDMAQLVERIAAMVDHPEQISNMRKNYPDQPSENALNSIMSMIFSYNLR